MAETDPILNGAVYILIAFLLVCGGVVIYGWP